MNQIYLKGIVKNIRYSHNIKDVVYNKADLIVKRDSGIEDILTIKYKEFSSQLKEDQEVELVGNVRSYSQRIDGKNKVEIYVFTYLDPVDCIEYGTTNLLTVDGRICKKDILRNNASGKHYIHFILANNLSLDNGQSLNSYIPCVAFGTIAKDIADNYNINDTIKIVGSLRSREYKKQVNDEVEIKVVHEVAIDEVEKTDAL